ARKGRTVCGTLAYNSYEALKGNHSDKSDSYSLGLTILALFECHDPFVNMAVFREVTDTVQFMGTLMELIKANNVPKLSESRLFRTLKTIEGGKFRPVYSCLKAVFKGLTKFDIDERMSVHEACEKVQSIKRLLPKIGEGWKCPSIDDIVRSNIKEYGDVITIEDPSEIPEIPFKGKFDSRISGDEEDKKERKEKESEEGGEPKEKEPKEKEPKGGKPEDEGVPRLLESNISKELEDIKVSSPVRIPSPKLEDFGFVDSSYPAVTLPPPQSYVESEDYDIPVTSSYSHSPSSHRRDYYIASTSSLKSRDEVSLSPLREDLQFPRDLWHRSIFFQNVEGVPSEIMQEYVYECVPNPCSVKFLPIRGKLTQNMIITYDSREAAKDGLKKLNYGMWTGEDGHHGEIRFTWYDPKGEYKNPKANIIVKNLPSIASSSDIDKEFSGFGEIFSILKKSTHAYIQYMEESSALTAIRHMNGMHWLDNCLSVELFTPSAERNTNVYVKFLPKQMTSSEFEALMGRFGTVSSAKLILADGVGRSAKDEVNKGYGYCSYVSYEAACNAIRELDGVELPGCEKNIHIEHYESAKHRSRRKSRKYRKF
ncbi:hypothetical protein ADUPG1_009940, partial [Aduncisulcus paluster]